MNGAIALRCVHLLVLFTLCVAYPAHAQSNGHTDHAIAATDATRSETMAEARQHPGAHTPGPDYDEATALALSQKAIGRNVGEYTFLNGKGQTISLQSLRGKPVLISLIYTSCYHVCPTVTSNLANIVKDARDALGNDSFSVLTIGFDTPNDTPDRMRLFAKQRGIDIADWHFVSASGETMRGLVDDVGFAYYRTPKGFDHLIQVTVIDAHGNVYRQVYGMAPELPTLVEPLKEILWSKQIAAAPIDGWINNIKLFCTVYDPTTGKYRFDFSPFIGLAIGVMVLGAIAWVIVRSWRESSSSGPPA